MDAISLEVETCTHTPYCPGWFYSLNCVNECMHVHMVSGLHGYPVLLTFNNAHLTDRDIGFREIQNLDPGRVTGSETLGRKLPHGFSELLSTARMALTRFPQCTYTLVCSLELKFVHVSFDPSVAPALPLEKPGMCPGSLRTLSWY